MANHDTFSEFTWGKAKASSNKERKYYTSFFFGNEEYSLYDNVIVYDEKQSDGHVAKIMKLWEEIASGGMMVLLRWFLRPRELPSHLQSQVVCENSRELFLAFGKGKGVSNENKLDCIERKCKVLCTSKDARNKQPSEGDIKSADYFFDCMYNVNLRKLSKLEGIVKILGEDVLFNKPGWVSNEQLGNESMGSLPPVSTCPSTTTYVTQGASQLSVEDGEVLPASDLITKDAKANQGRSIPLKRACKEANTPVKRTNLASDGIKILEVRTRLQTSVHLSSAGGVSRASQQDAVERSPSIAQQPLTRSASAKKNEQGLLKAKSEETTSTGRALFTDLLPHSGFLIPTRARSKQVQHQDTVLPPKPEDANVAESLCHGKVLLIQNVDSSINFKDMNELMKSTLQGCSGVQMLQQNGSLRAPAVGEALAVFETESLADAALQQFEENILVMSGCSRPLIARKVGCPDPGKIARFPGHFPLDNLKLWKQRQEEVMKKSFENFHFADPKTVEYEMALEWKNLHKWLACCWERLCKVQGEETSLVFEKHKRPKLLQVQGEETNLVLEQHKKPKLTVP